MWETDPRRPGIRSRGPKKGTKRRKTMEDMSFGHLSGGSRTSDGSTGSSSNPRRISETSLPRGMASCQIGWLRSFSNFPGLDTTRSLLLGHYVHGFSRTYPAFPGPDNPFLSVFVPLASKSSLVLHALLALSGIQRLDHSNLAVKSTILQARQKALAGSRQLLARYVNVPSYRPLGDISNDDLLFLLASSMLLLLYEKFTGEGQANWEPHFQFMREVIICYRSRFMRNSRAAEEFDFLQSLFAYHDLLRAMQLRTNVSSTFYEDSGVLLANYATRASH